MSFLPSAILRGIPGLFILNSGVGKIGMPAEASAGIQQMAATGIPQVKEIPSDKFGTYLGYAESAVAAALLTPFIPNRLAGAALTAFGGGLLTMYFGNSDNTEKDGVRPTQDGLSLAKDSWLLAIGLALMTGAGKTKKVVEKRSILPFNLKK